MAKMRDHELLAIVEQARDDAVKNQGEFASDSEKFLQYYLGHPLGNEQAGQSSVISTDCAQVVDSDMTSLARMFLGPQEVMEFTPETGGDADVIEARQKTQYVNHLIGGQKDSFRILHGWMKDALIQKISVLKYEYYEEEKVRIKEFDNLTNEELILLTEDLKNLDDDFEIVGQDQDEDGHYIKVELKRTEKGVRYSKIPLENFIVSRNATCKDDAEIVGDISYIPKGDLIGMGYDEAIVRNLPARDMENRDSNLPAIRWKSEGGENVSEDVNHWTSQEVEVTDCYILVDYDGDGLVERRRVVLAGNEILENEQLDHVPYALLSADLMPDTLIGRSLVEITQKTQDIKTAAYRQILDNMYRVNSARMVVNDSDTNLDDLLVNRPGGIVRTRLPTPHQAVAMLETPYIGDKALQVVQYVDSVRQQDTGGIVANQGLDSDQLQKETATRFRGAEKAATAKVEHIARNFAETGYKELYEGIAWLVSHYHKQKVQILYQDEQILIDPRFWKYDHNIRSNVGLAASSDEMLTSNLGNILSALLSFKEQGMSIVDEKKIFNTMDKIVKSMGMHTSKEFVNDPEKPEEVLLAENEQLKMMVMQLQEQVQQNPLADAEMIRAQAKLAEAQNKQETEAAKMTQNQNQFNQKMEFDYTKLELDTAKDIIGKGVSG